MSDRRDATPGADERADLDLEARLEAWLELRGRTEAADLAAVRASIATLPIRRRARGPAWIALAAAAVVAAVVGGVALSGRLAPSTNPGAAGDPAAFAGDPRLAACAQHVSEPATVFEMTHAQWFPLHFPGWWKGAPELEVDDPALVVVGREQRWPVLGAAPAPGQTVDPDAGLGYQLCIAIGTTSSYAAHDYGVTHFERIVPVLSVADVARAAHLDPDVLGDPAAWPFPERLAPCGGLTGNELYIFEANPISDFRRYFPAADEIPAMDTEDPGIVIVYRDPLNLYRLAGWTPDPRKHDICVVFETGADRSAVLPDVDLTGFHLRIDPPAPGEPAPSPIPTGPVGPSPTPPSVTPIPGPAWAGDPQTALNCSGVSSTFGTGYTPGSDSGAAATPLDALRYYLQSVRFFDNPIPTAGFVERDASDDAHLYTVNVGTSVKAAIVVSSRGTGPDQWIVTAVATCDATEFDPGTPTGRHPIGVWTDATGIEVPSSTLAGIPDCYDGTQVRFLDRLYVRTPKGGVDPAQLEMTWSERATLPANAMLRGYQSGSRRLYTRPDGKAIYIVDGDRVERLPHVIGDEVQRTDCN